MSTSILVAYATRYGSTQEVAQAIASILRESGLVVDQKPLREVRSLEAYRAVVLGAPLFMFRWHKDTHKFLSRHQKALQTLPVAVFALGPVHDPHDDKEWADSRTQLDKELAQYPWFAPIALEIFGGKYNPEALRFPLKMFAGAEPASDIRDWDAIQTWAGDLVSRFDPPE